MASAASTGANGAKRKIYKEVLTFPNAQDEKLEGNLESYAPIEQKQGPAASDQVTAKRGALIICHGLLSHRQWELGIALSKVVLDAVGGHTDVFRFDFAGNGGSEGVWEYGGYAKCVSDLRCAVELLRARSYEVHTLLGHSMGGNIVLLYGAQIGDVPNIINISARFDMKAGIRFTDEQKEELARNGTFLLPAGKKSFLVTQASVDKRLRTDMSIVRDLKNTLRVLTIHGTGDIVIPYENGVSFRELIPESIHTFVTVPDANHSYTDHRPQLFEALSTWIGKHSQVSTQTSSA